MSIRANLGELKRSLEKPRNKWPEKKRIKAAMKQYKSAQGYSFDINSPSLFTEKIIWYKLFYCQDKLERIVDKFLFKGFVKEKLGEGYTIPLLGAWETIDDFRKDWDNLPDTFCLKSTLMSDGKGIKIIRNKNNINLDALCAEVSHWLKPYNTLINSYCRAYYNATPRILAEELMSEIDEQLYDYKFLCFGGEPKYIYTYKNRFTEADIPSQGYELTYYDVEWKKQNAVVDGHKTGSVPKPKHFGEMLDISRRLSKDLPFVRVDFYEFQDRVFVGEMTLYPHGGLLKYEPREFNLRLGSEIVLPI